MTETGETAILILLLMIQLTLIDIALKLNKILRQCRKQTN
jgi:hypothetical protein